MDRLEAPKDRLETFQSTHAADAFGVKILQAHGEHTTMENTQQWTTDKPHGVLSHLLAFMECLTFCPTGSGQPIHNPDFAMPPNTGCLYSANGLIAGQGDADQSLTQHTDLSSAQKSS